MIILVLLFFVLFCGVSLISGKYSSAYVTVSMLLFTSIALCFAENNADSPFMIASVGMMIGFIEYDILIDYVNYKRKKEEEKKESENN